MQVHFKATVQVQVHQQQVGQAARSTTTLPRLKVCSANNRTFYLNDMTGDQTIADVKKMLLQAGLPLETKDQVITLHGKPLSDNLTLQVFPASAFEHLCVESSK